MNIFPCHINSDQHTYSINYEIDNDLVIQIHKKDDIVIMFEFNSASDEHLAIYQPFIDYILDHIEINDIHIADHKVNEGFFDIFVHTDENISKIKGLIDNYSITKYGWLQRLKSMKPDDERKEIIRMIDGIRSTLTSNYQEESYLKWMKSSTTPQLRKELKRLTELAKDEYISKIYDEYQTK